MRGSVVISGKGVEGGRNVPLQMGVPAELVAKAMLEGDVRPFGTLLAKNALPPRTGKAADPLPDEKQLVYRPLDVLRCSNGQQASGKAGAAEFIHERQAGSRARAMVLWLKDADLSQAAEVRFELRVSGKDARPTIILRDQGDRVSDAIEIQPYFIGGPAADGFRTVRIPARLFKGRGWDMKRVRLAFVSASREEGRAPCSVTVRRLEVGFPQSGGD